MRESCAPPYCGQANPENCPKVTDASLQAQQAAGIAALIGIATQVYMAMSETPTAIIPPVPDSVIADASSRHIRDLMTPQTETGSGSSRLRKLQARLQTDHLVRNSLYLMLSSGLQAALGFTFWVIAARLFSTTPSFSRNSSISIRVPANLFCASEVAKFQRHSKVFIQWPPVSG